VKPAPNIPQWWADKQRGQQASDQADRKARRAHVRPPWLAALGMGLIAAIELSLIWQGETAAIPASVAAASIAGLGGFAIGIDRREK
jgi:hypothetical protein